MTTHLYGQLLQPFYSIDLKMTKPDGLKSNQWIKSESSKPKQSEEYARVVWTTMLTKMITHEKDADKANIVLTIDNQRVVYKLSLMTLFTWALSREKDLGQHYGRQYIDVTLLTKTFIIDSRLLISDEEFDYIFQMYLSLLIDKQLNFTFKICLLDLLLFVASLYTDDNLSEEKHKKMLLKIGSTIDGKQLTKYVIARARAQFIDEKIIKATKMMLTNVTTVEKEIKMNLIHSLSMSSFNCLISVLIFTQTETKLYKAFIFYANASKILCNKILRSSNSDNQLNQQRSSTTPPLIEGIDNDFGTNFIEIEIDELNLHPCIVPMICLLKHIETNDKRSVQSYIPPWMFVYITIFSDTIIPFNIKLFIMPLITHTHTIFKPYTYYWLTSIIYMCNQMFEKFSGLNTFLIDTIVILLSSWNSIVIPSQLDRTSVQRLLEYLFLNSTHKNSLVMESNLDLIKKLIESWNEPIYAPTLILYKLISDQDIKSKHNAVGQSNERLLEELSFILKWHSGQTIQDT
ncbi:unnamed protein product [Rotaria sordida]|uniref:DNA-dependent protein kinase catalytic subunit CC3 domain-containing protein n=1 Tax=Rotaria sordida TaxID=392033 RepID=A0A819FW00_9BILA|nr:unnamed protein product [Rotaria sordida]